MLIYGQLELNWSSNQSIKLFYQENARENAVCYMAILISLDMLSHWGRVTHICMHWNENVVILTKFQSLAALEVVILTTSSAASDENLIKMKTFPFQCVSVN